jgi:hypothetical protein
VGSPSAAVEAGLDPFAWYIDHAEDQLDHFGLFSLVEAFREAGFSSIPIEMLDMERHIEELLERAREATADLIGQLSALHAKRQRRKVD